MATLLEHRECFVALNGGGNREDVSSVFKSRLSWSFFP
jgi:hypothetical protein